MPPTSQAVGRWLVKEIRSARWELVAGASSGMWDEQPDAVADALVLYLLG